MTCALGDRDRNRRRAGFYCSVILGKVITAVQCRHRRFAISFRVIPGEMHRVDYSFLMLR